MAETASALLLEARRKFAEAGIETAALDSRLLLLEVLGITYEALIANPDRSLKDLDVARFRELVGRRLLREPVSKIIGRKEFYGRSYQVSRDVLDPRPDTEALIELALEYIPVDGPCRILDLGSGSGAIAITLLAERPLANCVAVDVSPQAREMTLRNADALGVAARLRVCDGPWFAECDGVFDLVVSNPPYIPGVEIAALDIDVKDYDPHLALDGGADGLDCYKAIAANARRYISDVGSCVVEIGAGQQQQVTVIFNQSGFTQYDQRLDLGGRVRALAFKQA